MFFVVPRRAGMIDDLMNGLKVKLFTLVGRMLRMRNLCAQLAGLVCLSAQIHYESSVFESCVVHSNHEKGHFQKLQMVAHVGIEGGGRREKNTSLRI